MKQNYGAGVASDGLLQAMGQEFISKRTSASREWRRQRERQAKRERMRDLKEQKRRGI